MSSFVTKCIIETYEKGLYHCECILYDYISKKDYSRGIVSRNNSVGSGYKCNGPVMIKE